MLMKGLECRRFFICMIILLSILLTACSKDNVSSVLEEENILKHLEILNSPEMAGRRIGTAGNEYALQYIEEHFKRIGLQTLDTGEYRQAFNTVVPIMDKSVTFNIYDPSGRHIKTYKQGVDFLVAMDNYSMGGSFKGGLYHVTQQAELRKTSDPFKGLAVLIDYNQKGMKSNGYTELKLDDRMYMEKAEVILYKEDGSLAKQQLNIGNKDEWMPERGLIKLEVSQEAFNELAEYSKKNYQLEIISSLQFIKINTHNVMGILPGKSKLYEEYIIIATSFDGAGIDIDGELRFTPSDNGTSLALLLELARFMKEENVKTEATIIFAAFNGNYIGSKGVKNYLIKPYFTQERSRVIYLEELSLGNNPLLISTYERPTAQRLRSLQMMNQMIGVTESKNITYTFNSSSLKGAHVPFRNKGLIAVELSQELNSLNDDNVGVGLEEKDLDGISQVGDAVVSFLHIYGKSVIFSEANAIFKSFGWIFVLFALLALIKIYLVKTQKDVNRGEKSIRFVDIPIISYGLLTVCLGFLLWLQTWFIAMENSGLPANEVVISFKLLVIAFLTTILTSSVMLFWSSVYFAPIIILAAILAAPRFKLTDTTYLFLNAILTAGVFVLPITQYYTSSLTTLLPSILSFNKANLIIPVLMAFVALIIIIIWRWELLHKTEISISKMKLVTIYWLVFVILLIFGLSPFLFSEEIINIRATNGIVRF